jgi:DNA modification methylase
VNWQLINADVIEGLRQLPDASVHCVVTSPPYLWQRDYGVEGQIGLEHAPVEYVLKLISVFAEVRRVLRPDGTLWVNLGDTYANDTKWGGKTGNKNADSAAGGYQGQRKKRHTGLPPKSLMMIPARFAIAMQDADWILRSEIIWHNPIKKPESVQDRPSNDYEKVFLFSQRPHYYYDAEAVKQPCSPKTLTVATNPIKGDGNGSAGERFSAYVEANGRYHPETRNLRSVWSINSEPNSADHYAAFPTALATVCIQAGTSERGCCAACGAPYVRVVEKIKGDPASSNGSSFTKGKTIEAVNGMKPVGQGPRTVQTITKGWVPSCKCESGESADCVVLDPFSGTGTTGVSALRLGRRYVGIELNPKDCFHSSARLREAERNAIGDLFLPLQESANLTLF